MDYSTIDVLPSLSNTIEVVSRCSLFLVTLNNIKFKVLAQSCDKFQRKYMHAYLRVFNIFIKCLHRWFQLTIIEVPIKSKLQKQREYEEFKISGIENINSFSDDIMGKTAEEMYHEDMAKSKKELEESENEKGN